MTVGYGILYDNLIGTSFLDEHPFMAGLVFLSLTYTETHTVTGCRHTCHINLIETRVSFVYTCAAGNDRKYYKLLRVSQGNPSPNTSKQKTPSTSNVVTSFSMTLHILIDSRSVLCRLAPQTYHFTP
jgi:hypothetical protein